MTARIRTGLDAVRVLRDAKWAKGMSWQALGEHCGILGNTMCQWTGEHNIGLNTLLKALDALGLEMVIQTKEEGGGTDDTGDLDNCGAYADRFVSADRFERG